MHGSLSIIATLVNVDTSASTFTHATAGMQHIFVEQKTLFKDGQIQSFKITELLLFQKLQEMWHPLTEDSKIALHLLVLSQACYD